MASNKVSNYQPSEPPSAFARVLQENPLALGLIALVLGALIGILLPGTEKENELMGAKRDELLDQGRHAVEDLTHRAEAVAETAKDAAQEALEKAKGAAQEAVAEAVTSVKEEVKHQAKA